MNKSQKKLQSEALNKIYEYAKFFGNHKANVVTIFNKYKQAMSLIATAIYSHFGAFEPENDYMTQDLEELNGCFEKLEILKENI